MNQGISSNATSSDIRRVRPIAVAPPPGLESGPAAKMMENPYSNSTVGGYSTMVKFRAIAGALAGDWSSG